MPTLTHRQTRVLEYIRAHIATHGWAPTYREIAAAVGLQTTSAVAYQIGELTTKGYIRRAPATPRAISLCNPPAST